MTRPYLHGWPPPETVEVSHGDLIEIGIGAEHAAMPGPSPAGEPAIHLRAASSATHFEDMPWHTTLTVTEAERLGRLLIVQASALREVQRRAEAARNQMPLWP